VDTVLIISTFPEAGLARTAIRALVAERLVACGTLLPGAESIYAWKGGIETGEETVVLLKAPASSYPAVEQRLRQLHPYEIPEIVSFNISQGFPSYLEWILESCSGPPLAAAEAEPAEAAQ
jgi:periplasmic divalent cation tolerance protein